MNFLRLPLTLSALVVAGLALAGCPRKDGGVVDTPQLVACEADEQCPLGNLCIAGECRLGACNPAVEAQCGAAGVDDRPASCCKVFENCNGLTLSCERDPEAVGIGCPPGEANCIPCTENRDCVSDLGFSSFCSGGRCFAQEGLQACTQDFQCAADERCDRTEFFCVKDSGGCRFCGEDFPELCCENGQVCDVESGVCVDLGDRECTVETAANDCRAGLQCDANGRCVQCIDNGDCGPGTECNPATGLCIGTATRCSIDSECPGILRCVREACIVPQCTTSSECFDSRERCEEFRCILPPAVCSEGDEPNNDLGSALALESAVDNYSGILCRGDQDVLTFPVSPLKRYTVTIASSSSPTEGLAATLRNTAGDVESSASFGFFQNSITLVGATGAEETGRFEVVLNTGSATARDAWSYAVTLREDVASLEPDCSDEAQTGQEPNGTFDTATILTADGMPTTYSRCGVNDLDYFAVSVPPLHGVEVTVDGFQNAEGNLDVELFRAPVASPLEDSARTSGNSEVVEGKEGVATFYVRVSLAATAGVLQNQSYAIRARAVPRPPACNPDVGENDGETSLANELETTVVEGLATGEFSALRCNAQDIDYVRLVMPSGLAGVVRLAFVHSEGDLRLSLFDATGNSVGTSNVSAQASGVEAVDVPAADEERIFFARVEQASMSAASTPAQNYRLTLSTYEPAQCLVSEPTPDGTASTGRCVGDFTSNTPCNGDRLPMPFAATLEACTSDADAPGCGHLCGNADVDVYRLGSLNSGRTVQATVRFHPSAGNMTLHLAKGAAVTPLMNTVRRDTDGNGVIDLETTISGAAADYSLVVKPDGLVGHEAQVYALSIDIAGACVADAADAVTPGNATPATSTSVRDTAVLGEEDDTVSASLCSGDVDVYEFLALASEQVTIRATGLVGLRFTVGTRPQNLASPALPIDDGEATAGVDGKASLTFTSPVVQRLFLTVDRVNATAVGNYRLTFDYTLPVDNDGDGLTDDAGDADDDDACVPDETVERCDADDDGSENGEDDAPGDPCIPDPEALACPSGDADGDGTPNGEDPADDDACEPTIDVLVCADGDADADGTTNGDDDNDADACIPSDEAASCDFDGDGETVATDEDDKDACVPDLLAVTCDADGDGTAAPLDDDDDDVCVPSPNEGACDADGDGEPNETDAADDDVCVPTPNEEACDADSDGTPNGTDDEDDNVCVPTPDESICDADADGESNGTDADPEDPCLPTANEPECDADGDGTRNDADDDDNNVCVPTPNEGPCDSDGDGSRNDEDTAPQDPCVPTPNEDTCDADGDGEENGTDVDDDGDGTDDDDDAASLDPCVPVPNEDTCDADGDGEENATDVDDDGDGTNDVDDAASLDPCVPVPSGDTCDADGDGVANGTDNDDDSDGTNDVDDQATLDPCVPEEDVLACPRGDEDDDGSLNGSDPDDQDGCVPNACPPT
jgi:hypothetical protein